MALQFEDDLQTTFAAWPMAANGLAQTNVTTNGKTAPIPGAIEILPTPTGAGTGYCCTVKPGDPITYGAIRAYVAYGREPAHNNGNAAERWYRWDWYFPPDWTSPDLISVMQFHDTPDDPELPVVFPNFELMTQGDDLWCWVPLTCTARQQYAVCPPGYGSLKVSSLKGRWLKCAIHCNWSNANDGYLEVWIDGKLFVRDWFRPNSYDDIVGPYWVVGIYDWTHGGLSREYKLWHRNVKIYNTGDTAETVLETEPKLPPRRVVWQMIPSIESSSPPSGEWSLDFSSPDNSGYQSLRSIGV